VDLEFRSSRFFDFSYSTHGHRGTIEGNLTNTMKILLPVLLVPVVWIAKSIAYIIIFRIRKIHIAGMSCFIIGGAPFLLSIIPVPLPVFVSVPVGIGIAVYLTMQYAHVELIPNGLFIPLVVEVFFRIGIWGIEHFTSIQLFG